VESEAAGERIEIFRVFGEFGEKFHLDRAEQGFGGGENALQIKCT
jgi:hypothetical protein